MAANRDEANQVAFGRLTQSEPVLVDVRKAGDVLPGMKPNKVLTSGPPMPWEDYFGTQRLSILYGALYEGLAETIEEADEKIQRGEIILGSTHAHGCVATSFAVYTSRMSVFVVEDRANGTRGYCNLYEGDTPRRLGTGCYGEDVLERLRFVEEVLATTIGAAVRLRGGLPLRPIISRSLHLGDDLHVRTTAGTILFLNALLPALFELAKEREQDVRETIAFLEAEKYSFFRVWLAAAKAASDAATGVEGASLLTVIALTSKNFAIRVSGLGERWFLGPPPRFEGLVQGAAEGLDRFHNAGQRAGYWHSADRPIPDDCSWTGTDSPLPEVHGFGAFASAAAFSLQTWHNVSAEKMVERNLEMYKITTGEHPEYKIPYLAYRGVPVGIDIFKVLKTGITPMLNGGLARKDGAVIGSGVLWTPMEAFETAAAAYRDLYGDRYDP